jgi:hypothetical protein
MISLGNDGGAEEGDLHTGGAEVLGFQKEDRPWRGKLVAAGFQPGVFDIPGQ